METVQFEGKRRIKRSLTYFNLDVIIAVGYRVNSFRATQFRIWATKVLKNYLADMPETPGLLSPGMNGINSVAKRRGFLA
jgi:hypothetical protein